MVAFLAQGLQILKLVATAPVLRQLVIDHELDAVIDGPSSTLCTALPRKHLGACSLANTPVDVLARRPARLRSEAVPICTAQIDGADLEPVAQLTHPAINLVRVLSVRLLHRLAQLVRARWVVDPRVQKLVDPSLILAWHELEQLSRAGHRQLRMGRLTHHRRLHASEGRPEP